jgi:hypothetical protein
MSEHFCIGPEDLVKSIEEDKNLRPCFNVNINKIHCAQVPLRAAAARDELAHMFEKNRIKNKNKNKNKNYSIQLN